MANRNYIGKHMYSMHAAPVEIDFRIDIGSSGAVSNLIGPLVSSVTRMGTGLYQIKLSDNYNKVYSIIPEISCAPTGSAISISGSSVMTIGQVYQIVTLGTSTQANWEAAGLSAGVPAAVGVSFASAITGSGTGTGTVTAMTSPGTTARVVGDPNLMCSTGVTTPGSVIILQCYGNTSVSDSTQIPKDPASGSKMQVLMLLSNSSIVVSGE